MKIGESGTARERLTQLSIALAILLLAWIVPAKADELDDYIGRLMKEQQVPGAVIVVLQNGTIVEQRAYGLANIEFHVPMKVEDVFTLASITKLFTATAIFELVQDGKVRLDDRVSAIVPGLPEAWKDITILHCLSHTSGLPDLYEDAPFVPIASDPAEAIRRLAVKQLAFKPGDKSKYNQTGFLLLRIVIERISGKPFEEFMAERVFRPLALRTARFGDTRDVIPNKATIYSRFVPDASRLDFAVQNGVGVLSDHQLWIIPFLYPESVKAGAGLAMNALDLARFDQALSAGTLLNARTVEMMWAPVKLSNGGIGEFTAGWHRWGPEAHLPQFMVGHAGGSGVEYIRMVSGQYSVIVLTNCASANAHQFTMGIMGFYTAPKLVARR
jgi:CubicO group peptidase (beta-lactamase class C family)